MEKQFNSAVVETNGVRTILGGGTGATTAAAALTALGALGLSASSYIIAKPGDDLAAKYTEAKALTPNGAAKSATNRASLIIFPGTYSINAELVIDTEFVDIIGLGAQFQSPTVFVTNQTLNVTANNVCVSGVSVGAQQFKIGNNKPLQIFENCTGGDLSFGSESALTVSGFFKGCVGADYSFGGYFGAVGGTFIDCVGGTASFGRNAHGEFNNCTGGSSSFGGGGGIASGTFTDCVGSSSSFGGGSGLGSATGNFTNCVGGGLSFGSVLASGTFTNCTADYYSFGRRGIASGNFINCTGSTDSFGGDGGEAKGYFINCKLTMGQFPPLTSDPLKQVRMINCVDGDGNIIEGAA
jgi:hypothetical protein